MALRTFLSKYEETFLNDRYDLLGFMTVSYSYIALFGDYNKPFTTTLKATVAGCLWPVAIPMIFTGKIWQENKNMIIAKHHHKHKKELWVDDFLIDLDE